MRRRDALGIVAAGFAGGLADTAEGQERVSAGEAARPSASGLEPFPGDPHRPRYHFLPPRNWMNDPNGLIYHKGFYHLFYQHNPGAAVWGNMHWGHAVSRDLLAWRSLPIALAPTPDGYDKDGVFSGCAVGVGDRVAAVYTGTKPEVQAVAFSDDPLLERWEKYAGNPVIAKPPEGMEVTGFRDPFVWREDNEWLMALGSGVKGKGGAVLLYRSRDLLEWEYLHPLVESEDPALGTMWECPSFFPLGSKHVLLISPIPLRKALYCVGVYEGRRFRIEKTGSLDDGGHFYAPQAFLDAANRRVLFGWCWEGRSEAAQVAAGWAGVQTLPRVLELSDSGGLEVRAHPICQRLVRFGKAVKGMPIDADVNRAIAQEGIGGNAGRLNVTIQPGDAKAMRVSVHCSADGRERTDVVFERESGALWIDRSRSSLNRSQDTKRYGTTLRRSKKDPLLLTIYLDRSMVEVFAGGDAVLSSRVYPELAESVGIQVSADGKKAELLELTWHPIAMRVS